MKQADLNESLDKLQYENTLKDRHCIYILLLVVGTLYENNRLSKLAADNVYKKNVFK